MTNPEADPGWAPLLEWAEATYAAHGLPLPTLEVMLQSDPQACAGRPARFDLTPAPRITICRQHTSGSEMLSSNQRLVLHELAHAWIHANVADSEREAFTELRRLDSWNDSREPWSGRGCEQAANVIARALVYGASSRAGEPRAFTILTGIRAPFGVLP